MVEVSIDSYDSDSSWYAVWTRSRQEKVAATMLESLGVPHFLPLKTEVRQWSDRRQKIRIPLFPGYLFVRIDPAKDSRLQVLKTPGIVGFVGNQTGPLPIPDAQIENIQTVLIQQMEYMVSTSPLLEGQQVRVVRGALAGVVGTLIRSNSRSRLLISIEMIHKSISVSISPMDVEVLGQDAA
jgi:transcription antitermination factor NusG